MRKILVLGAGRSATTLIHYLDTHARSSKWRVTVADSDALVLEAKVKGLRQTEGKLFHVSNPADRARIIGEHDFVISLLPWTLHPLVARECIRQGKHMLTASYVSPAMKSLALKASKKGLFFLGEMGLDPGIDHMSALELIRRIRRKGGDIRSFRSVAGGLVAPGSDDNPWHYKFTWNPRNVVLAGQGISQFREQGQMVLRAYPELFAQAEPVTIGEDDHYEVYPNRDSLHYEKLYDLEGIPSLMRGTVRFRGFCRGWHALIRLGLTEGLTALHTPPGMTWDRFTGAWLSTAAQGVALEEECARFLDIPFQDPVMEQLRWLGIFSDRPLGNSGRTAADHLQTLLEEKWALRPNDRDLVVMEHRIGYGMGKEAIECRAHLRYEGKDVWRTAMADLVGLPLAVTTRLFLKGHLPVPGMPGPFEAGIYEPVLAALKEEGVSFEEIHISGNGDESVTRIHS